jgi:hypothetical protein
MADTFYSTLGEGIWSASRIDDLICPRRYYHSRIQNLRSLTSSAYAYAGGVGHVGLDKWYSTDKDDEAALSAAESEWGDYVAPSDPQNDLSWLNWGHLELVLRAYFDRWREDSYTVLESEVEFTHEYPGFKYGGRRDRKMRDELSQIFCVDTKFTTGNMGDYWFRQFQISNQMRGYWTDDTTGILIDGAYMGKDGIVGYHPVETYIDKAGKERKKKQRSIAAAFQREPFTYSQKHLSEWEENVRGFLKEVAWRTETDTWPQCTAAMWC